MKKVHSIIICGGKKDKRRKKSFHSRKFVSFQSVQILRYAIWRPLRLLPHYLYGRIYKDCGKRKECFIAMIRIINYFTLSEIREREWN